MKFIFFHQPAIRKFNYKPLYFDPAKEELEKRRRTVLGKEEMIEEAKMGTHASRIKGAMKHKHISFAELAKKEQKKSTIRVVVIIVILSLIAYYLYSTSSEWLSII